MRQGERPTLRKALSVATSCGFLLTGRAYVPYFGMYAITALTRRLPQRGIAACDVCGRQIPPAAVAQRSACLKLCGFLLGTNSRAAEVRQRSPCAAPLKVASRCLSCLIILRAWLRRRRLSNSAYLTPAFILRASSFMLLFSNSRQGLQSAGAIPEPPYRCSLASWRPSAIP